MTASTTADVSSARARRWATIALLSCVGLFFGLVSTSLTNNTVGIDFGVFHAGGDLIQTSGYSAAYDTDVFSSHFADQYFPSTADQASNTHFISTPTFGWAMQPIAAVPFDLALVLWLTVGALLLLPAVRLLGLPPWVVVALLISPAMAMNASLGQTGPYVLLLFVVLHREMSSGRLLRAGAVAGLLILKPPLALGYGVFWLVGGRRYLSALAVATSTGIMLSVATFAGGTSPWIGFLHSIRDRAETEGTWSQQSLSLPEFLKLLVPSSGSTTTVAFWILGLATAVGMAILAGRRWGGDAEMFSAAAVVATVVASPHLLVYDSFILIIPVAVAYRRGLLDPERVGLLAAIIATTVAFSPTLYDVQHELVGRGIGLEFPGLVCVVWLLLRWENESSGSEVVPARDMVAAS